MDMTYQVIALAILVSSVATGFITFRMHGMKLALHFVALMLALLVTVAAIVTGTTEIVYAAAALQFITAATAYSQTWATLKYNFQTSPSYAPHLALVTLLPALALASML
jgi:hypothetical protein